MTPQATGETLPRITVVILNWNNWKDTILAAESVLHNDYENRRIIIADNASTDDSVEKITAWAEGTNAATVEPDDVLADLFLPPCEKPVEYVRAAAWEDYSKVPDATLTILQTGDNLGYAGGNNAAIQFVTERDPDSCILILGNDTAMPKDLLRRAAQRTAEDPLAASVYGFSQHDYYDEPDQPFSSYMTEQFAVGPTHRMLSPSRERKTVYDVLAYGGAMMISPRSPVRFFPEEYFLYCEDSDFCRQVMDAGGRVAVHLDLHVYEKGSGSVGRGSPLQVYYTRRNKLFYSRKFYSPFEYAVVVVRMTVSTAQGAIRSFLSGDEQRTRAYLLAYLHYFQGKTGRRWPQG